MIEILKIQQNLLNKGVKKKLKNFVLEIFYIIHLQFKTLKNTLPLLILMLQLC